MAFNSVLMVMMLASVAIVTGLSVLPGTDPLLTPHELDQLMSKIPPGLITAPPPHVHWTPRYCLCVVRCCKPLPRHALQKRRVISSEGPALAVLLNNPLVRHKRCCGCHPCNFLLS